MLSQTFVQKAETVLREREERLAAELGAHPTIRRDGYEPDQIGDAVAYNNHNRKSKESELLVIMVALERIKRGDYGVCQSKRDGYDIEGCEGEIPEERLLATKYCTEYCCVCAGKISPKR